MRGRVVRPTVPGRVLQGNPLGDPTERVTPVYLPPSYDDAPSRRYPVIYALTGFTGTGRMLLNESFLDEDLATRLDRLIGAGEMGEAIVVMPDCMTRYGGSQYVDSGATGRYGTYTAEEVVAWTDAEFARSPTEPRAACSENRPAVSVRSAWRSTFRKCFQRSRATPATWRSSIAIKSSFPAWCAICRPSSGRPRSFWSAFVR
jgi:hypothetical protein